MRAPDDDIAQTSVLALQAVCRYHRGRSAPAPPQNILDAVSILEVLAEDLRIRALERRVDLGELLKDMPPVEPCESAETREGNAWADPSEPVPGAVGD